MRRFILYGNDNGKLANKLSGFLKERMEFSFYCKGKIKDYGKNPKVEILDLEELEKLDCGRSIIALKRKANLHKVKFLSPETMVIVHSENRKQLESISRFQTNVITIGLSPKDTITFSSRGEEQSVVALQRTLTTLEGNVLDPMEIPCRHTRGWDDFSILYFTAVLLLLNLPDWEQQNRLCLE